MRPSCAWIKNLLPYHSGFCPNPQINSHLKQLIGFNLRGMEKGTHTDMTVVDTEEDFSTLDECTFTKIGMH